MIELKLLKANRISELKVTNHVITMMHAHKLQLGLDFQTGHQTCETKGLAGITGASDGTYWP